ncbi:MAG: (2Fe-2S)-binding protein [Hydrocarboniphaga sp.]|uniref:2Fe-2S iron-sulfur cluster-binding protein n=1 Tax=Hydrocarboniphaga sp. TaxID=2033016 RepID=UPI00260FD9A0|nr:2Fe-2S iron-sulfur cluster-binding protein [Hydrocarboniphaga sp.]MDB5970176.1 (2Fe-2S)-binding protein [Hydrocarboniphaga sp.]
MVHLVFQTRNGQQFPLEAAAKQSLMNAAVAAGIPGIDADCGGSMVCGTCHVHIAPQWRDRLPPISDMEQALLECVPQPHPDARLSCQIPVSEQLQGLVALIPSAQR